MKKRTCAECGNNRFGLIRHYVGFKHFCCLLCKERHKDRRARELREQRDWLAYLSRPT